MQRLGLLIFAAAALSGCAQAPDSAMSCADLADARAASELRQNLADLEEREVGQAQQSEVERMLYEIDAKKYREQVYRECLRQRGETPQPDAKR